MNLNGLWIHIKVPDGVDWSKKKQELEWPVSVTFSPFTFLINAERLDDREGWRRKKQTAILKGQNEKMGAYGWRMTDNESQNGETVRDD